MNLHHRHRPNQLVHSSNLLRPKFRKARGMVELALEGQQAGEDLLLVFGGVKSILEGATTPERLLGHSLKLDMACDTSSRRAPLKLTHYPKTRGGRYSP